MFRDNLSGTSSKVNKLKRENRAPLLLTDNLFSDFVHQLIFLKKHDILEAVLCPFSSKEAPDMVDPLDWAILSQWAP
jgi:hypothetical protein